MSKLNYNRNYRPKNFYYENTEVLISTQDLVNSAKNCIDKKSKQLTKYPNDSLPQQGKFLVKKFLEKFRNVKILKNLIEEESSYQFLKQVQQPAVFTFLEKFASKCSELTTFSKDFNTFFDLIIFLTKHVGTDGRLSYDNRRNFIDGFRNKTTKQFLSTFYKNETLKLPYFEIQSCLSDLNPKSSTFELNYTINNLVLSLIKIISWELNYIRNRESKSNSYDYASTNSYDRSNTNSPIGFTDSLDFMIKFLENSIFDNFDKLKQIEEFEFDSEDEKCKFQFSFTVSSVILICTLQYIIKYYQIPLPTSFKFKTIKFLEQILKFYQFLYI